MLMDEVCSRKTSKPGHENKNGQLDELCWGRELKSKKPVAVRPWVKLGG